MSHPDLLESPVILQYDLDLDGMQSTIADYCRNYENLDGLHYFEVAHDTPMANVGRSIERTVFEEKFGNTSEQMHNEYGPYESQSTFFIAVDTDSMYPVGVMRIIEATQPGHSLKLLDDMRRDSQFADKLTSEALMAHHGVMSLDDCWELGTIAIMPDYRNKQRQWYNKGAISAQLIRTMYLSARSQGVNHMMAAMDTAPYEKMVKRYLGLPYVPLCSTGPFPYLGSDSTQLIYGHVPDFYREMSRKKKTIQGKMAYSALRLLVDGKRDDQVHLADGHVPRAYRGLKKT